jgi:hypothetical protein
MKNVYSPSMVVREHMVSPNTLIEEVTKKYVCEARKLEDIADLQISVLTSDRHYARSVRES